VNEPDIMAVCRPHVGVWRGVYVHRDTAGAVVDRHDVEIVNAFPGEGPFAYVQTSRFIWSGRREEHVFPGVLRGNRLWWETERLAGHAFVSADAPDALFLKFRRVDLPGIEILEMIQLAAAEGVRMRSWQWLKDGVPFRRTAVDETRVATGV
jgi:hypothetical protein